MGCGQRLVGSATNGDLERDAGHDCVLCASSAARSRLGAVNGVRAGVGERRLPGLPAARLLRQLQKSCASTMQRRWQGFGAAGRRRVHRAHQLGSIGRGADRRRGDEKTDAQLSNSPWDRGDCFGSKEAKTWPSDTPLQLAATTQQRQQQLAATWHHRCKKASAGSGAQLSNSRSQLLRLLLGKKAKAEPSSGHVAGSGAQLSNSRPPLLHLLLGKKAKATPNR